MIINQAQLFLIFVVNGILIGLLFDIFRILRKSFKTNDFVTYLEDILFWILTGLILLYSIFIFNNGEIRLYMFLGVLLGCTLYMLLFSSYVIKINVKIILFLKNTIGKTLSILFLPIKCTYQLLKKIFQKPISFMIINIRKFSTNLGGKVINLFKFNKNSKNNVKN